MAEIDGMRAALDQSNAARVRNFPGDALGALMGSRHVREPVNRQQRDDDLVQPVVELVEGINRADGVVDLRGASMSSSSLASRRHPRRGPE